VVGGVKKSGYMTGRIEVRQEGARERWRTVCADGINQEAANVVCREVQYDRAILLGPSFFGSLTVSQAMKYIADIKCTGRESSIKKCKMATERNGICSIAHYNYASVMCIKNTTKEESEYSVEIQWGLVSLDTGSQENRPIR
jgi:hypothetical protein